MPFRAKMLPAHWSNYFIRKNEMIIGRMKYFIGKMISNNRKMTIRRGKILWKMLLPSFYMYSLSEEKWKKAGKV